MKKFIGDIVEYAKDNPEGYWFKAKLYGYGWMPVRWQGWMATVSVASFIVLNVIRFEQGGYLESAVFVQVIAPTFVAVAALLFICIKTGEKPRWQWGPPQSNKENRNEE